MSDDYSRGYADGFKAAIISLKPEIKGIIGDFTKLLKRFRPIAQTLDAIESQEPVVEDEAVDVEFSDVDQDRVPTVDEMANIVAESLGLPPSVPVVPPPAPKMTKQNKRRIIDTKLLVEEKKRIAALDQQDMGNLRVQGPLSKAERDAQVNW